MDPEQEVHGLALQAVDAALDAVRPFMPSMSVMRRVEDIISPGTVAQGEPIRAVDLLWIVTLLLAELPAPPPQPTGEDFMTMLF